MAPASLGLTLASLFVPFLVGWSFTDKTGGSTVVSTWNNTFADLGVNVASPVSTSPSGGIFIALIYYLLVSRNLSIGTLTLTLPLPNTLPSPSLPLL